MICGGLGGYAAHESCLRQSALECTRYTPPGGTVTVMAGADEEWVRFSVSDTGRGIPGQYLGTIFEKFFRVHRSGGTG